MRPGNGSSTHTVPLTTMCAPLPLGFDFIFTPLPRSLSQSIFVPRNVPVAAFAFCALRALEFHQSSRRQFRRHFCCIPPLSHVWRSSGMQHLALKCCTEICSTSPDRALNTLYAAQTISSSFGFRRQTLPTAIQSEGDACVWETTDAVK